MEDQVIMVDDVKVNGDNVVDLVRGSNLVGSKVQGLGVPAPRALCIRRGLRVKFCLHLLHALRLERDGCLLVLR